MIHKLMSKIRFHIHKTMTFYYISTFLTFSEALIQKSVFFKKIFFHFFFKNFFFVNFQFEMVINDL